MPQPTLPAADPGLPLTRRDIERHVDALIDLLDTLDADPDLEPDLGSGDDREGDDPDLEPDSDGEPSLGWHAAYGYSGDSTDQSSPDFYANADAGCGLEDEHDGSEPDVDDELWLGWTDAIDQDGPGRVCDFSNGREFDEAELEPGLGSINPTISGTQETWAAGGGDDQEDEHCGAEPDIEEGSLGWTNATCQDGVDWHGGYHGDLEGEHDGREPDDSGIGDMDGLQEQFSGWNGNVPGVVTATYRGVL